MMTDQFDRGEAPSSRSGTERRYGRGAPPNPCALLKVWPFDVEK